MSDPHESAEAPTPDPLREELLDHANLGSLDGRIVIEDWAGGLPEERAQIPSLRIRKRWFSTVWFVPIAFTALVVAIAVAQQLRTYDWMKSFIAEYPGTGSYAPRIETGLPWWLRWQHYFNIVFMMFIIRSGIQILAEHPRLQLDAGSKPGREWFRMRGPVPPDRINPDDPARAWTAKDDTVALPGWVGIPGFRHSIGLARWFHFSFDILWLVNGVIFFVLLFASGEWRRIVPTSLDVFPNAASTAIQYASLDLPQNSGFARYNGLQILAYFITVFIAAPLAMLTGLLQAPAVAAKFGTGVGPFNRQVARTLHFLVLAWMLVFILIHTTMVWVTGLLENLSHVTLGSEKPSWWALAMFAAGMAVVAFLWAAASPFTIRYPRKVQRIGHAMTGRIDAFMEWWNPRASYSEDHISPYFWPNGHLPDSDEYKRLLEGDFADYKLRIDGLVAEPIELTYAQIKAMPKRTQITQNYCIQGWSGIAKWGGVAMSDILAQVQPDPRARWVVFYAFSEGPETGRYYDCHPVEAMHHELTILAYEMNDEPLSVLHGAPLRLRNETELGFKQVKWIEAIELVESFEHLGAGQGGYNEDQEFFGYRMPI